MPGVVQKMYLALLSVGTEKLLRVRIYYSELALISKLILPALSVFSFNKNLYYGAWLFSNFTLMDIF